MSNLAVIDINAGERLIVRRDRGFSLIVLHRIDEDGGRIELEFSVSVSAVAAMGAALEEARFKRIGLGGSRALVVVLSSAT